MAAHSTGSASITSSSIGGGGGGGGSSSSVPGSASNSAIWLRLAVMSIARRNTADYLMRSLYGFFEQTPSASHPMRAAIDVVVVNNNDPPEKHTMFFEAYRAYADRARFINKVAHQPPLKCPSRAGSRVKASVQQQTCDLAAAFRALLEISPPAKHVMLLEDDWLLCPHGFSAISHALEKAYLYDSRWLALRVSYGFNGVIVRQDDLSSLATHLAAHFKRRPPDHLLFEWFAGERPETKEHAAGRSYRIFRYNVFHHIGHISTLSQPANRFNPGCYALLYDWLLPAEVFNEKDCPDDDIWPCREAPQHKLAFFATTRLQWSATARKAVDISPDNSAVVRPFSDLPALRSSAQLEAPSPHASFQRLLVGVNEGSKGAKNSGTTALAVAPSKLSVTETVVATRGEGCTHACAAWRPQGMCSTTALGALNTCEALRGHMDCAGGCDVSVGDDQPALVASDAPAESRPRTCLINSGAVQCEGAHPFTTRLCACVAPI